MKKKGSVIEKAIVLFFYAAVCSAALAEAGLRFVPLRAIAAVPLPSLLVQQDDRMGLILWPTILSPTNLDDPAVHSKIALYASSSNLSVRELFAWYVRYIDVQRRFVSAHPNVLLVDAASGFAAMSDAERQDAFSDLCHLTAGGNRSLADFVRRAVRPRTVIN